MRLSGNQNVPRIEVKNESRDPIIRIELTVGDISKHFDLGAAGRKDTAKFNVNLAPGVTFATNLDIDDDVGGNTVEDYRRVMFNNGADNQNSVLTIVTLQGDQELTESITLTDGAADEVLYVFYSDSRPRTLRVSSIAEVTETTPVYISRCTVKVNGEIGVDLRGAPTKDIGEEIQIRVFEGDSVEVSAPQAVYNDANGNYLTDSSKDEPTAIRVYAMERFVGLGISVNDVPQTGDPTLYRFTVEDDSKIAVKWRHDYALRMAHDFVQTQSSLKNPDGTAWVGPLESDAVGNPSPEVKLHWIQKGETVIAQIDGQVQDYSHPGLNIRYVPTGWDATGVASASDDFLVGQSPPSRQQIPEFTMTGPGSITYVWQIQYGVNMTADSVEHSPLPIIRQKINSVYQTVCAGEGTYWFNPGTEIQVLCSANENDPTSLALSAWMNGDGYYFGSQGNVDSSDGSLLDVSAVNNGTWVDEVSAVNGEGDTTLFRGVQISGTGLQRPVRVMWQYDNQAIAVTVPIGEYVFQDPITVGLKTYNGATFLTEPTAMKIIRIDGSNQQVSDPDMAVWDNVAAKLYPVVPGIFRATWPSPDVAGQEIDVLVTVIDPVKEHYPHIAGTPTVNLDPDPDDSFIFQEIRYTENEATVDSENNFDADTPGRTVLLFSEIDNSGRSGPKEYLRVRMVKTRLWNDANVLHADASAVIGKRIEDSLDLANLKTGYLFFPNVRCNPFIYDSSKLAGLGAPSVYDMAALSSTALQKLVVHPENLPGPVIPVNLNPGAGAEEKIVVVWYDDPAMNDGLLWPYASRIYNPRWPVNAAEGLGRIVIASQFGSESLGDDLKDQVVAEAITNVVSDGLGGTVENIIPAETTYNPSRIQQPVIYSQPDITQAGYNPNEEHALMAPSLRFAQVSPRPPAAYALRNNDLNRYNPSSATDSSQPSDYTSHPFVLTQFYDAEAEEFRMRVYKVVATVPEIQGYTFANSLLWKNSTPSAVQLYNQPHVVMEAGEPVIPFYPLGVVVGAVPPPESFGQNITSQLTYWEDHKNTSWAVSGGTNAWFTVYPYYPLLPDFWWEDDKPGRIVSDDSNNKITAVPNVGDSLAFLPQDIDEFENVAVGGLVYDALEQAANPKQILYKSDWPDVAPTLKAGETLTFSGGEHRADHPTTTTLDEDGNLTTVETPGLPQVLAFAAAEIVFDSLNPLGEDSKWVTKWTARVGQVLESRTVDLAIGSFPDSLLPATGRTRISQGKYVFNELPASLQKRFRYDAVNGKLEIFGLVNDKDIGDDTLTASPPAVYVLEPNILTDDDIDALKDLDDSSTWTSKINELAVASRNPNSLSISGEDYFVGLEQKINRSSASGEPIVLDPYQVPVVYSRDATKAAPLRALGPGLAVIPNADFLDPSADLPDVSWITVVENNDPSLGGSPVTPHIIRVDRTERYRGAIQTVLSDNVFDENVVLRHQGDFGAHADDLVFEWWYRPDDGSLDVPPPDLIKDGQTNPWKLFPDLSGNQGAGRYEVMLKGNPNAPEALLADTWWFCRYRHKKDTVDGTDWGEGDDRVNFTWAGAGNSDPFNDFDLDGLPDFQAQLAMGWIKRVLDAVNPYEARIRDFEGDSPSTISSMIQQFGARYEGPVALNPDKNVIENVGLIELYQTIGDRAKHLSYGLSRPICTPAIANAVQLASTRISDFYTLLGNEAYSDAQDPTIGFGSDSVDYGHLAPAVFTFQNQMSSLIEEELGLLRGLDDGFARPVYNRLFWNFTKGEGEAAYAMNYNISDINADGFINEDDAMALYPQGHGDAWGHYLTAERMQYNLLKHPYFNWVSRSEYYNLMDVVMKVDFLDERKFAQIAAAKAKTGAEIVNETYREKYVEDPIAQWQGYRDSNPDRAWGVEGWARRAGQGAYFDWITANALLPSEHPNETLEGIQKVDRASNGDIAVVSANLNAVQTTFDQANNGYNPLGLSSDAVVFDIDPQYIDFGRTDQSTHFGQIYERAVSALENAKAIWDYANESDNRVRKVATTEAEFRNDVYQENLTYRNRLIEIFGRPYEGTIGSGKLYAAGYDGPDLALFMYTDVVEINDDTVPGPTTSFAEFDSSGELTDGDIYDAFDDSDYGERALSLDDDWMDLYAATFASDDGDSSAAQAKDGWYSVNYTELIDGSYKVDLENLDNLMPISTSGYAFQAPDAWGNRLASGQLQQLLSKMLQQEAEVAKAIAAWDALTGEIVRTLRIVDARIYANNVVYGTTIAKHIADLALTINKGITTTMLDSLEYGKDVTYEMLDAGSDAVPDELPTAGFSFSPGDALGPASAAILMGKVGVVAGFGASTLAVKTEANWVERAHEIVVNALELSQLVVEHNLAEKEWLKEIEDLVGDEPALRVAIFKEIEALRDLSNQYRTMLDEGVRLVDERTAYNKRVAAATQLNRYQDMTFRVARNHALQQYRSAFDLASRYAYLAAKAYDYETCFQSSDAGAPQSLMEDIVAARTLGLVSSGVPQVGAGGLADALARLKANFDVAYGQLGISNPQTETGKISLRTEKYRIFADTSSDEVWERQLKSTWVDNLWEVPEFRQFCRPLDSMPDSGAEPGLVIRFETDVKAGENLFGRLLSGGDHSYDPSVYAIKIRAAGVWFSDYQSEDMETDMSATPRVYLVPAGMDILSYSTASDPTETRYWNVVDQRIPMPMPALDSELDQSDWIPVFDNLSGQYGEQRRFSSFRAYHDGSDSVNEDELVYDSRLIGRSVRNTQWVLIIPGRTLNADPEEGLNRFIDQVSDIKLVFDTYGYSGN